MIFIWKNGRIFVATWIAKVFFEQIGISKFNQKYNEIRKSHLINIYPKIATDPLFLW